MTTEELTNLAKTYHKIFELQEKLRVNEKNRGEQFYHLLGVLNKNKEIFIKGEYTSTDLEVGRNYGESGANELEILYKEYEELSAEYNKTVYNLPAGFPIPDYDY